MAGRRINFTITDDDASAVEDALSYYLMCEADNFGMGYDGADGETAREAHDAVKRFMDRVSKRLEELNRSAGR